jgi:AcrR family transcriptional regulator
MGVKERKAREKETLRQDILDAARELFIREGYQAVSMRKIAEKIEYSPATIYLHFRDKDDIFDHLSKKRSASC